MSQLRNTLIVQCYFNLEEKIKENASDADNYDFMRRTLMPRAKEYSLKLTYKEHIQFLGYWLNTQDKKYSAKSQ